MIVLVLGCDDERAWYFFNKGEAANEILKNLMVGGLRTIRKKITFGTIFLFCSFAIEKSILLKTKTEKIITTQFFFVEGDSDTRIYCFFSAKVCQNPFQDFCILRIEG